MAIKYFVVDTFAWIEYFKGSESGLKLFALVKDKRNELFTPLTALAEFKDYCEANAKNFDELFLEIMANSRIVQLDESDAIEAGKNHFEMKKKIKNWGYMDSFVLAVHKKMEKLYGEAMVVTGDLHFKEMACTHWIK